MNPYILAARQAVESQYDGICNIIEHQKVKDPKTKKSNFIENVVKEEQACKVSYEDIYLNTETETQSKVVTKIKLFIAPELDIKPGSKIVVTQKGRTTEYKNSGEPAIYDTHQEIMLEKFKEWA